MIKKNNRKNNRVIYADGDLPTPKPKTCKELRVDYCNKELEAGAKEGQLKDATVEYQKIFGDYLKQIVAYNKGRKNWFNKDNLSEDAKRYYKKYPDNQQGSIDDLVYLGEEKRKKDKIRKKYPPPQLQTPEEKAAMNLELKPINDELAAIFGNPVPFVPVGLIRELRSLKNTENLVDVKSAEKDKISKEKNKLDDELKKIKEDIEKKVPKCNIPKC
jgi:hypothetical protein